MAAAAAAKLNCLALYGLLGKKSKGWWVVGTALGQNTTDGTVFI